MSDDMALVWDPGRDTDAFKICKGASWGRRLQDDALVNETHDNGSRRLQVDIPDDPRVSEDNGFIVLLSALGPFIHVLLMPYFMLKKKAQLEETDLQNELSASGLRESAVMDADGKTVVFAIKFTLCQKVK